MPNEMLEALDMKLRMLLKEVEVPVERAERIIERMRSLHLITYSEGQKSAAPLQE